MTDRDKLIKRLKYFLRGDREPITEVPTDLIEDAIAALSPVLPDEVERVLAGIRNDDFAVEMEIPGLIEQLARENQQVTASRESLDSLTADLKISKARIEELEGLLLLVRDDLRMRGEIGRAGETVVNLSASVWDQLNKALQEKE